MNLTPRDGHFCNFSVFCVNVSKNARVNFGINVQHIQVKNVPQYGELFTINNLFHNVSIIFVSLVDHLF